MSVACPKCGSRFLRESRRRKTDKITWFTAALRCQHCHTRFIARTFVFSDLRFAHCPKCRRMDLNSWSGKTYEPPFFMKLRIALGAKRWRCEYCRVNFASFRRRKEIFTFSRWQKIQAGISLAEPSPAPKREPGNSRNP